MSSDKPQYELKELRVDEISLVTEGANQLAHILLVKAKEDKPVSEKIEVSKAPEAAHVADLVTKEKLAQLQKEIADKEATIAALSKGVAALEKAARKAEIVKSVESTGAGVDANEAADVLISAAPEVEKYLLKVLGQLAAAQKPLLKTYGISDTQGSIQGDALEKISAIVAKKLAADPSLGVAKAEAQAWRENPGLYDEYQQKGGN